MIKWIKKQIRTIKLVNAMKRDIKHIYGDVNYHAYTDYVQSKRFKQAKKLNDLGL